MPYKLVEYNGDYSIIKNDVSFPKSTSNRHYIQFIEDIALGNDTVVGPDTTEQSYIELRQKAYPSLADQLDMQYWDGVNGTTTWADAIQAVKNQYPSTITGGTSIGDVPDWVQEEADQWLFDKQLKDYTNAVERLAQYVLADGREQVTEMQDSSVQLTDSDGTPQYDSDNSPIYEQIEVITVTAIDPVEATVTQIEYDSDMNPVEVEVENPLITKDNEERASAQAVIDATPQAVIDEYNS